jgi:hypothetical protein
MATERPAKAKRILVVEDELMIRMLLEDMLSELGNTVAAEAAGIEEALEATKNAVPRVFRVQPPSTTPVSSALWLHEIKHWRPLGHWPRKILPPALNKTLSVALLT